MMLGCVRKQRNGETHWEKPADFIDEEQERPEAMADGSEGEFEPLGTFLKMILRSCFQILIFMVTRLADEKAC